MKYMSRIILTVIAAGSGLWLLASAAHVPAAQDPEVQFQRAVQLETIEGDLDAAIDLYKQVIKNNGNNRAVAAKALLRLGGCYEKLGNSEAQKAYQRVMRDFADQAEQVEQARARLAAMKSGGAAQGRQSTMAIRRVPSGNAAQTLDMYTKPSPDGKYLAHTDWKTGNLAILDVVTGATRLLTKDGSWGDVSQYADFSVWSRDSKRIAFQWSIDEPKQSRSELRVVSLDERISPRTIAVPGPFFPIQWTRDGLRILCEYSKRAREVELALVPVNGGEPEKLNIGTRLSRWTESQLINDDTFILYSNPADGKAAPHDIYMQNLKTGATTPVIQHPAEDLLVGVIPGTDWLLFASNRRGRLDLWGVQFRAGKTIGAPVLVEQGIGRFFPLGFTDDGRYYYATLSVTDDVFLADFDPETKKIIGTPRKLASQWEGANMHASFSPDGGSFAYVTKRSPMPIPTHTADSLVLQSLKEDKADPVVVGFQDIGLNSVGMPCWVDGGRSVVVGGSQGQQSGLYRVDIPSLQKTKIYSAPEGSQLYGHVCASQGPFAYLVVFASDRTGSVIRIDLDGSNAKELYKAPPGRTTIALSPDGKTLSIIQSVDSNRRTLLVMPSQGGAARQIHELAQPSGGIVTQTWSTDGKSIFYIVREPIPDSGMQHWIIARVPVDGGKVSEQSFEFSGPFFYLQFHPNGRLVAFTGRSGVSTESEVWVIENLKDELKDLMPTGRKKQ